MERDLLLEKYLNGSLSPEEKTIFEARPDYDFNKMLLEDAQAFKASEFSQPTDFESLQAKLPSKPIERSSLGRPLLRYAAVISIAVASYFLFFYNQLTTFSTQLAQQTTVQLPDASTVTLNALSSIAFDQDSWDKNRSIDLVGEAYFKVAKGATFDVVTDLGTVQVLGTQFSVKQREGYFEVLCYEGKVSVLGLPTSAELLPGEAIRLLDGQIEEFSFNQPSPSWIDKRSSFNNVPLTQVLAEFERQYDVRFIINTIDTETLFHGVFVHDSLENALKQITLPLSLTYVINDDNTVQLNKSETN
ncbi:MAG: FecR domain-containing protein [Gilvibacter sp.]